MGLDIFELLQIKNVNLYDIMVIEGNIKIGMHTINLKKIRKKRTKRKTERVLAI